MKYWFYLDSNTYAVLKDRCILLYNTFNGKSICKEVSTDMETLFHRLLNSDGGCIVLSETDVHIEGFRELVHGIEECFMGSLVAQSDEIPPFIFPFHLDFKVQTKYVDKTENLRKKGDLSRLLYEVSFIPGILPEGYTGYPYFYFTGKPVEYTVSELWCHWLVYEGQQFKHTKINMPGCMLGDPRFIDCLPVISTHAMNFVFHYRETLEMYGIDEKLLDGAQYTVYVDEGLCNLLQQFEYWKDKIKNGLSKCELFFLVDGDTSSDLVEEITNRFDLSDYQMIPWVSRDNTSFIEDNVFLDGDEICSGKVSKKRIFLNQVLNSNDFGRFYVMPDGDVYANLYFQKLGNLKTDSIRDLVYKEMSEGESWLRTRTSKPCSDCVYQWLCPSPSNYELMVGKPNLCYVKG